MEEIRVKYTADMAEYKKQMTEATVEVKKLDDAAVKANSSIEKGSTQSASQVKTLKTQIREATLEYMKLAETQGESSKATLDAAKKIGQLKDQMGDLKKLTDAFNPDKKFIALRDALELGARAYQGVIGVQALLGTKSEELEKTLLKVQAAMSVADSLSSLLSAGDAYKNLKSVIVSSVIPALSSLKGALIATGVGAAAVALGLLIANWDAVSKAVKNFLGIAPSLQEALEEQIRLQNKENELIETNLGLRSSFNTTLRGRERQRADIIQKGREEEQKLIKESEDAINKISDEKGKEFIADEQKRKDEIEKINITSFFKIQNAKKSNLLDQKELEEKFAKEDQEREKKKTDKIIEQANRLADWRFKNYTDEQERSRQETISIIEAEYKKTTALWDSEKETKGWMDRARQNQIDEDKKFADFQKEQEDEKFKYKVAIASESATAIGQIDAALLTIAGKNNTEYAKFSKAIAVVQIAIKEGIAIASAIETATPGDPYTVAIRVAAAVASVVAGIVAATNAVSGTAEPSAPKYESPKFGSSSSPKFKDGVVNLQGPGTWYSDSINAWLSKGESVIPSKQTKAKEDELRALNESIPDYEALIYRKYVKPAVDAEKKKAESFADNVANSYLLQIDDSRIVKELRKNRPATSKDIEALGEKIESSVNKSSFLKRNSISR